MDKSGMLGEIIEQGQAVAKQTGKNATDAAKAAVSQITGSGDKSNQSQPPTVDKNFVKDLYGIKDPSTPSKAQAETEQPIEPTTQNSEQTQRQVQEKQKLAKLRQELHQTTYYEPTFNPPKKQEERPAEKVEKEKKEEQMELQQKEAKKPPEIAVQRAQQKTESFPGASG